MRSVALVSGSEARPVKLLEHPKDNSTKPAWKRVVERNRTLSKNLLYATMGNQQPSPKSLIVIWMQFRD
jgi:hypothetical protein